MPTTWWQYWLYGLIELTRPHWFGRWTIGLFIAIGLLIWMVRSSKNTSSIQEQKISTPDIHRAQDFESIITLRQLAVLLLKWSWDYDRSIALGVTLLGLQQTPKRNLHHEFLMRMERSLYDPLYDTKVSLEETKQYMIDHEFFDWLTQWWTAN